MLTSINAFITFITCNQRIYNNWIIIFLVKTSRFTAAIEAGSTSWSAMVLPHTRRDEYLGEELFAFLLAHGVHRRDDVLELDQVVGAHGDSGLVRELLLDGGDAVAQRLPIVAPAALGDREHVAGGRGRAPGSELAAGPRHRDPVGGHEDAEVQLGLVRGASSDTTARVGRQRGLDLKENKRKCVDASYLFKS